MSQPTTLNGKVALITGAARRIGAAIARRLHSDGANVAIHYRDHRSADAAAELCEALNAVRPDSALPIEANLNDTAALPGLIAIVLNWHGRLDSLINNASSFYPTTPGDITEAQWDDLLGSNLKAPLFLSQAALPHLKSARGVIINLIDIHATRPLKNHSVYGCSKAGLAMLTRSLARDLAPEVRVNGVAPGAILWPESGVESAARKSILQQIPLQRMGDPDDIAGCVTYLIRDAGYVTGQIIAVDGGRSVGW